MRPTWPLPVGGISRSLISRESKNREIRENLAPRKFPGIRYKFITIQYLYVITRAHTHHRYAQLSMPNHRPHPNK